MGLEPHAKVQMDSEKLNNLTPHANNKISHSVTNSLVDSRTLTCSLINMMQSLTCQWDVSLDWAAPGRVCSDLCHITRLLNQHKMDEYSRKKNIKMSNKEHLMYLRYLYNLKIIVNTKYCSLCVNMIVGSVCKSWTRGQMWVPWF